MDNTAQADPQWTSFVNNGGNSQATVAPPPPDQKWNDFVQSRADLAPPTVGQQIKGVWDQFVDFEKTPPEPPQAPTQVDKDVDTFRNSDSFQNGLQNFKTMVNDAVLKPAINDWFGLKTVGQQYQAAIAPLNDQPPTDKYGNEVAQSPEQLFQRGMDAVGAYFGVLGLGVSAPAQIATAPVFKATTNPETGEAMAQGFGSQLGTLPFMGDGAEPSAVLKRATDARIPEGEDAYFNKPPKTPITPEQPAPDIHSAARNIDPETFQAYDRLTAQRDVVRGQLADLQAQKTADLDAQIKAIQDAKQGNYGKLQSLIAKRDDLASQDTPEQAALRKQLQAVDFQMRDLASKVSDAYRTAQENLPNPLAATEAEKPNAPQTPPAPENPPSQAIADDITKRLVAAGRPQDEAEAAGQITARFFGTMSDMYGGSKGTAEEFYAREGAFIKEPRGAKELAQTGDNELQQARRGSITLATDAARATIKLFKNADASTFMHESAHNFLDIMKRYADEVDAPSRLKSDVATIRKWLGPEEGPFRGFTSKQHEAFARAFERYLMEGVAPSPEMASVFAKFQRFLNDIYKTIKAIPGQKPEINDDIRDLFDRLLVKNPQRVVIAGDRSAAENLANIHEEDARTTPPEKAEKVADNIRDEIKKTAKDDKEALDAIKQAEKTGASAGNQPSPEPATANPTTPEPTTVGTSGSTTPAESPRGKGNVPENNGQAAANRPKPTRTEPVAGGGGTGEPTTPTTILGKPKSYYIDDKGVINFDLFKTPEDIQNYLQEWADKNPDKIFAARGGVVTLDQTIQLAESMGMTTKDLLDRKVGQLYDGPQQVAAAQLFIQSAKRIKDEADTARASGDPQKIADFINSLEDHKDFMDMFLQQVGISAEASRALGARRAIRKLGGFEEAMNMGELFQRMTGMNMNDAKAQADLFASLDTPQKVSKLAQKTREANWFDYGIAYRNNDLLSGPITHIHYLDGNIINALYKPLKTAVASIIPGGPKLGEAGAMYNSMVMGSIKGWKAAKAAWRDGTDKTFQSTVENYKRPTKVIFNPTFQKFFNVSSRAIGSIHTFGYTLNYEQEIARFGFRQALKDGLQEGTSAFNDRVSDLQIKPTQEMIEKADALSKKAMYMKNPEYGSTLFALTQFANQTAVGRFMFPFAKMELNVKAEGLLDNTVLGLFSKDVRANLLGANGSETRAIQIAGMAMGTSLIGTAWAMGDHINGNGPANANQRKVWLLTHTPNSIQIGDVAIPLRAMGNVGQVLMAAAELKEAYQDMTELEAKNTAAIFMEHVSRIGFQGTFIQNASDTVNAFTDPVQYGSRFLQNTAEGFVPYTTLLAQTNRYIDPFVRDVHSDGLKNLYGITDYVKSRIPFVSETLEPRVDVLGNPIPTDSGFAAGSYDRYIENPLVQKLQSIGIGIAPTKRDIMGIPLTAKQYNDYAVTSGTLISQRLWNTDGYGVLQEPNFDGLSAAAKVKEVDSAIKLARKAAVQDMLFRNPDILERATTKKEDAYQ